MVRGRNPRRGGFIASSSDADPVLVYHPDCVRHVNLPGHVESPQRIEAIVTKRDGAGLLKDYIVPEPAAPAQVDAVHTRAYMQLIESFGEGFLDTDTAVHEGTYDLARLAAGGAVTAAQGSVGADRPSFALVRPPGHHAGPDYGGGFCYLNNVAIAAKAVLSRAPRVAILDFDAHHGNGTQDVFASSREVLYVSTHQWGIFPGTGPAEYVGEGRGEGFTVNVPLPARSGDETFDRAFTEVIEPIVRQFRPDAMLVSFGGDAHYRDPLTQLGLSSTGYVSLVERTLDLGRSSAHGRVAFVLEGGYYLPALAEVVAATCARIRGESLHLQFREGREDREGGREAVNRARAVQSKYWDL